MLSCIMKSVINFKHIQIYNTSGQNFKNKAQVEKGVKLAFQAYTNTWKTCNVLTLSTHNKIHVSAANVYILGIGNRMSKQCSIFLPFRCQK